MPENSMRESMNSEKNSYFIIFSTVPFYIAASSKKTNLFSKYRAFVIMYETETSIYLTVWNPFFPLVVPCAWFYDDNNYISYSKVHDELF